MASPNVAPSRSPIWPAKCAVQKAPPNHKPSASECSPCDLTPRQSRNWIVRLTKSGADSDTRRRAGRCFAGLITARSLRRPPKVQSCSAANFQAPSVSGTGSCFPTRPFGVDSHSAAVARSVAAVGSCNCSCSPRKIREIGSRPSSSLSLILSSTTLVSPPSSRSLSFGSSRTHLAISPSSAQLFSPSIHRKAAYTAHRISTRHSILEHQLQHHFDSASLPHARPPVVSHGASIDTAASKPRPHPRPQHSTLLDRHTYKQHTYTSQSPPPR